MVSNHLSLVDRVSCAHLSRIFPLKQGSPASGCCRGGVYLSCLQVYKIKTVRSCAVSAIDQSAGSCYCYWDIPVNHRHVMSQQAAYVHRDRGVLECGQAHGTVSPVAARKGHLLSNHLFVFLVFDNGLNDQ